MNQEEFNYEEFLSDDFAHMRNLIDAIEREGKKHDPKVVWEYIRSTKIMMQNCWNGLIDYRQNMIQDGDDILKTLGL